MKRTAVWHEEDGGLARRGRRSGMKRTAVWHEEDGGLVRRGRLVI